MATAAVLGGVAAAVRRREVVRRLGRIRRRAGSKARYVRGRLEGVVCRWLPNGRRDVDDGLIADRIRSSLGTLEHELDVPRVHVTVERGVALLHGEVGTDDDAETLAAAAGAVAGVREVRSHLHVGLPPGATRPSAGSAGPSSGLCALLDVARRRGGGEETAHAAVAAVLGAFAGMLVPGERDHVRSHLAGDVAELFAPAPGVLPGRIRHVDELYEAVVRTGAVAPDRAPFLVDATIAALRELVPDEAADVRALLPTAVRAIWDRKDPLFRD